MSILPFDDRDGVIWLDGRLVPWRNAQIHVLTHALHYASCVFEGERIYDGKVFKLREHSQRLIDSGRMLGFELPLSLEELMDATNETVEATGIPNGYVRPVAWRGPEQMGVAAQATKIHVAIAIWEWPSYFSPEARVKGIRMKWAKWARPAPNTAPTAAKAAGLYMICTLAKHDAEAEGYDDALMLDWRGQLAEATGANLFLAIDGQLHTPTPDCFLDGITRQTVIGLARDNQIKVVERAIWPDELAQANEVFITGTAAEITPVGEIGDYSFTPGPVTNRLIGAFDKLVGRA
ncbi:MAG: branched-chain amino acid aminotransferase [Rhodospirillales bacterium]|jgi:branched-chain amino acid aminotransferase|nr:branched-chain amino acid aminotransferase [Rhodospirillales bacterium]